MSGRSGVVGISGSLVAANLPRVGLQITAWDVPLHVGLGSTPYGRVPDAIVPANSMWEPPHGMVVQQDVYLASSSGEDKSYHVTEFRR